MTLASAAGKPSAGSPFGGDPATPRNPAGSVDYAVRRTIVDVGGQGLSMATAQARRDLIAGMLEERDSLSVAELAAHFHVTDTSIRHDLTLLEQRGRLRRVHGGAVSRLTARANGLFSRRASENPAQKRRIGLVAALLGQAGNVV